MPGRAGLSRGSKIRFGGRARRRCGCPVVFDRCDQFVVADEAAQTAPVVDDSVVAFVGEAHGQGDDSAEFKLVCCTANTLASFVVANRCLQIGKREPDTVTTCGLRLRAARASLHRAVGQRLDCVYDPAELAASENFDRALTCEEPVSRMEPDLDSFGLVDLL